MRYRLLVLALSVLAGACDTAAPAANEFAGVDASSVDGLLPSRSASEPLPDRFGFGRPAAPEEIAPLAIAIMPDGRGLPAGSGTPADGGLVYAGQCAACHGAQGEGGAGGRLVGRRPGDAFDFAEDPALAAERTIGSYWPYATTLFDYIRRAMPFDRPGSLSDDEVYALTAWLLWKNEIIAEDAVVDASTLPRVVMPASGRFVTDDRETSTRVR